MGQIGPSEIRYDGEGPDATALVLYGAHLRGAMPALALRIRPTDRDQWWTGNPGRLTTVSQRDLALDVLVPSSDDPASQAFGQACPEGNAPFIQCRIGHARLVLERDAWTPALRSGIDDAAAAAREARQPYATRTQRTRAAFWLQAGAGGRRSVGGWDCSSGRPEAFVPAGAPPHPSLGCVARNPGWWERLGIGDRPARQEALYECQYGHCSLLFLFAGREARLHMDDAGAEIAASRDPWIVPRLLSAAWALLERARAEAQGPPPAPSMHEARLQAGVCQAVIAEAARWSERPEMLPEDAAREWAKRQLPCRKAVRLLPGAPAAHADEAERLLGLIDAGLMRMDRVNSERDTILASRLSLIEQLPEPQRRRRRYEAIIGGLHGLSSGRHDPQAARKRALLEEAWQTAQAMQPAPPVEQASELMNVLLYVYINHSMEAPQAVLRAQWAAFLERGAGADDRLVELRRLMEQHWQHRDLAGLKQAADRARLAYLERPPEPAPAALPPGAKVQFDPVSDAAYYAMLSYRNYVLGAAPEPAVLAAMVELAERMESNLGPRYPYVRAARAHLDEVQTGGRLPFGTPYGASYLQEWE